MSNRRFSVPVRGAVEVTASDFDEAIDKALEYGPEDIQINEAFEPVEVQDSDEEGEDA